LDSNLYTNYSSACPTKTQLYALFPTSFFHIELIALAPGRVQKQWKTFEIETTGARQYAKRAAGIRGPAGQHMREADHRLTLIARLAVSSQMPLGRCAGDQRFQARHGRGRRVRPGRR
jgi:hypothetical protein